MIWAEVRLQEERDRGGAKIVGRRADGGRKDGSRKGTKSIRGRNDGTREENAPSANDDNSCRFSLLYPLPKGSLHGPAPLQPKRGGVAPPLSANLARLPGVFHPLVRLPHRQRLLERLRDIRDARRSDSHHRCFRHPYFGRCVRSSRLDDKAFFDAATADVDVAVGERGDCRVSDETGEVVSVDEIGGDEGLEEGSRGSVVVFSGTLVDGDGATDTSGAEGKGGE